MTLDAIAHEAVKLRQQLAAALEQAGHVRSPEWRTAVEDVSRHEFLPEFFARREDETGPTLWAPVDRQRVGVQRWLEQTYTDDSYVTQLDGHVAPPDVTEAVTGTPTSSSTMPSLVVRMWEDPDVHDGHRVLEIGTGTGYSTALGCHRLGDEHITSIEVDAAVADRARRALQRVGYHPHLVVGDGLSGVPGGSPYDRIIATCSMRSVPPAWIEQSQPGTIILVTLSGWLGGTALAKLTVTGPDTAEGTFLPGYVSFMPARTHAPEPAMLPDVSRSASARPTVVGPEVITTYGTSQLLAQFALPDAQYLQLSPDGGLPEHIVVQPDESYATLTGELGAWTVRQGGPQNVWDQLEAALATWRRAGEPDADRFQIFVDARHQVVQVNDHTLGTLPT